MRPEPRVRVQFIRDSEHSQLRVRRRDGLAAAVVRAAPAASAACRSPVISVGNLGVGGSGKTPRRSIHRPPARRTGRASRHPHAGLRADARPPTASPWCRMERTILAQRRRRRRRAADARPRRSGMFRCWSAPTATCRDRLAERQFGATVHLLDDGFQHLQLARDVDLLVVDEEDLTEHVLPAGRLREPLAQRDAAPMPCS